MNLILVTREEADQQSLMHYRTKGSKNGQRLYQYENGRLTPLGRIHYGAMYGWNSGVAKSKSEKAEVQAQKAEMAAEQKRIKAEELKEKESRSHKTEHQLRRGFKSAFKEIKRSGKENKKEFEEENVALVPKKDLSGKTIVKEKNVPNDNSKKNVAIVRREQLKEMREDIKNARNLSDDELNKALNRLRMEKQYAELLNERVNREKSPVAAMASKLFQEAAQDLAKKALGVAVDKLIDKAKSTNSFKLADFKDVDPYSLPSDKLKAVSEAFNMAANLARNRNVVNNGGRDPNQGNSDNNQQNKNQQNTGNKNQNGDGSDAVEKPNGPNGQLSKNQRKAIANAARSGQSAAELARRYGVSESTIYEAAGGNFQQKRTSESSAEGDSSTESKPTDRSTSKPETPKDPVDRSKQNWSYMTAASSNRQQLQKNLDMTKRNVKRAEKFFDSFSKEVKLEADEKAKEERLKQFSDWVNGAEWAKEKVKIQAKQAQDEEIKRQAKVKAQAIADEVRRDFERRDAQAKAEKKEAERQAKARKSARMFGYSW